MNNNFARPEKLLLTLSLPKVKNCPTKSNGVTTNIKVLDEYFSNGGVHVVAE